MSDALEIAEALAKPFESLHRLGPDGLVYPYHDPVGYPTQGYGHLLSREPWAPLDKWPPVSVEQCEEWLAQDLGKAARSVMRMVKVELSAGQAGALIDFAFNAGGGNLQISTLLRRLNRGDYDGAAEEFGRWVFARGVRLPGLVRRRAAERLAFES